MLLKLVCYITFLVLLAQSHHDSTNLDYSDQCARVADYQENDEDYCWNFNNTCTTIFERKQVCQSMELSCSQEQKTGSCVLVDCDEYTPDANLKKYQEHVNWLSFGLTQNKCHLKAAILMYFDPLNDELPTENDESPNEKLKHCCSIGYNRMAEKLAYVCRNTTDDSGCQFHICSPEEMEKKEEESVKKQTVRLTPVSEKDIDVTELAVDAVFDSHISQNISRAFCPHFHNRCMQMLEQYFGNGDFEVKESTCIPDIGGEIAQAACILIKSSDVESNEIKEEIVEFGGTTATGKVLDVTELAAEYAHRYSNDDGRYCENFIEGCTLVMNLRNFISHKYQRKEVTCNKCILVKNSEIIGSQILAENPSWNNQRKLRLSEETEHLIPMKYGTYCTAASSRLAYRDNQQQQIEYLCSEVHKRLEAKIENICRNENDTFYPYDPNSYGNFHRCTPQEELEKKNTPDPVVVRHTPVSEKDIDMTSLATHLTLNDGETLYTAYPNYCREFRNTCWQLLDRFFYNTLDYQVKENTCHSEEIKMSAEGKWERHPAVPLKSACILIRVDDK